MPFYMSVGGVSNTASSGTFQSLSGNSAPVWQFSLSQAPCTWSDWKKVDRSKISLELKGNGFENALLWSGGEDGYGLGTEKFPGVIVASQDMKVAMEKEFERARGIYHPYPPTTSSRGGAVSLSMVGYYNGSNLVASCIGTSGAGSASVLNDGVGAVQSYSIYVNPQGLFSSWTDGSVESVLEAAWVYKTFHDPDYDLDSLVKAFYKDFYGYDLGDNLGTVLDGRAS